MESYSDMILLILLLATVSCLLLFSIKEYYTLYIHYDNEISEHAKCRQQLHIVNDYLAYYEQCMKHGDMAMSLDEFIKLYHHL